MTKHNYTVPGINMLGTDRFIAPSVIEKASHNMASIDIYSKLLTERIIYCTEEISPELSSDITAALLYLDSLSHDPITLYINSPGGCVSSGLAIIDTMNLIQSPVHTVCMGVAASMASLILASGEKGHRRSLKHGTVMIHQPSTGIGYINTADLEIEQKEMSRVKKVTFQVLADATGKTLKQIYKDADRNKWFDAEEALEYGLIDEII